MKINILPSGLVQGKRTVMPACSSRTTRYAIGLAILLVLTLNCTLHAAGKSDGDISIFTDDYYFKCRYPIVQRNRREEKTLFIHIENNVSFMFQPHGTYYCDGEEKNKWFEIYKDKTSMSITKPIGDLHDKGMVRIDYYHQGTDKCKIYLGYFAGKLDIENVDLKFDIHWREFWREKVDGKWVEKHADKHTVIELNKDFSRYVKVFRVGAMLYGGDDAKQTVWEGDLDGGKKAVRRASADGDKVETDKFPAWKAGGKQDLLTKTLPANNCLGWWAVAGGPNWQNDFPPQYFYGKILIGGSLKGDSEEDEQGVMQGQVEGESKMDEIRLKAMKIVIAAGTKMQPSGFLVVSLFSEITKAIGMSFADALGDAIKGKHSILYCSIGEKLVIATSDGKGLAEDDRVTQFNPRQIDDPDKLDRAIHRFGLTKAFSVALERPQQQGIVGNYAAQGLLAYSVLHTKVRGQVTLPPIYIEQVLSGVTWDSGSIKGDP